jgi:predicted transcriptional regulator
MSITFSKAYVVNGQTYATLEQAQEAALAEIIQAEVTVSGEGTTAASIAALLVASAERVINILTTKENSRPAGRKINGGKKRRKDPQQTLPGTEPVSK